ncbi:MAG: V-type ATP synthase subunit E [Simkaniaceae bacterium]|nr:MAG: V-type ATP synthase subunit E [Simkaniaceae bacterium]
MMKSVDTGKEKVKKICEVLRKETIDPAKKEGGQIIAKARSEGERIVANAKEEAARLLYDAKKKIEEERNVFQASINLACKKSIDTLKQEIEKNLFNPQLAAFVGERTKDPKVVAELITAIINGINKEGINGDFRALVSKAVNTEAVNKELSKGIVEQLESKSVELGEIEGGAQVKIVNRNLTIDMSDDALKSLLANFVRDDFRSVIFAYE